MTASRRSTTTAQSQRSGGVYTSLATQQNPSHTPTGRRPDAITPSMTVTKWQQQTEHVPSKATRAHAVNDESKD
jgi:hypothetical protein